MSNFPRNMHKETINVVDNSGNISVLKHDITTDELIKTYSKNTGILYKNDRSVFDFANLAEQLIKQSKLGYSDFYEIDESKPPPYKINSYIRR